MNFERKENFVKGKKITDFKAGETLYIQKTENGFMFTYLCGFISYECGKVTAKIIGVEQEWLKSDVGKIITAKSFKCYLWGARENDVYIGGNCCHWCEKGVFK